MSQDSRNNLYSDIYLLIFVALMCFTGILMSVTGHLYINIIYMGLTILSILITYFYGIFAGLIENLFFIFVQIIVMIYLNGAMSHRVPLELSFWLVMPTLLSVVIYFMTTKQRELQTTNNELRNALIEQGAFDTETKLRTMVAYVEDAQVFIETNRRFNLPVTTIIIRIRYYNELKRMMSQAQMKELLKVTSDIITSTTRDNDITYYLDDTLPTWGSLLYTDDIGAKIAAERIRKSFAVGINTVPTLESLKISLVIGVSSWDAETMKTPYDLIDSAVKETEYDVPES